MIYVVNMRGTPYYKIGYTNLAIERRKAQLQTGCPLPIDVVTTVVGERDLETRVHQKWQAHKADAGNEWFTLTKKNLEKMLRDDLGVTPGATILIEGEVWPLTTTFKQWLAHQKDRDDVVGDLARDVIRDPMAPDDRAGRKTWRE